MFLFWFLHFSRYILAVYPSLSHVIDVNLLIHLIQSISIYFNLLTIPTPPHPCPWHLPAWPRQALPHLPTLRQQHGLRRRGAAAVGDQGQQRAAQRRRTQEMAAGLAEGDGDG